MDAQNTFILKSEELQERGQGVRFAIPALGEFVVGFVVRFNGKPYAYINQCVHQAVELDWNEGDFFTGQKDYLICATHGALYRPDNGFCVAGPCKGRSLKSIDALEQDGKIIINLPRVNK